MKKPLLLITLFLFIVSLKGFSQSSPVWTQSINAAPDSAYVFPVKTLVDGNNNVLVLSTWMKTLSSGMNSFKIYLHKYTETGSLVWNLVIDSNGIGDPRGFDMATDGIGNFYIAGGLLVQQNFKPLLIKVNSSGSVVWQRDSTSVSNTINFDQVVFRNGRVYVKSSLCIAMFDVNGNEVWANGVPAGVMAVDNAGQVIAAVYFGNPVNLMRWDSTGTLNLTDTTINASRIAFDASNNFYLLSDISQYEFVKYNSNGTQDWSYNNYPPPPPFGDYAYDVVVDNTGDVILVGIADSMYKYSPSGNLIWTRSMNGLDIYSLTAKIVYNNFLAVTGAIYTAGQYDIKIAFYDLNGMESWSGVYNSNVTQEFTVDFDYDNSGIYVLEDSISNSTLIKFENNFFALPLDFNLICVDSVWYDPSNPNIINVTVFNGNLPHLNYPSVQIVSPNGDTVGNPGNFFTFFAHMGNGYQTYSDTITDSTITSFAGYTFIMTDNLADTTAVIGWCDAVGISEHGLPALSIFPNPAIDQLNIRGDLPGGPYSLRVFNILDELMLEENYDMKTGKTISVSSWPAGMYFLRVTGMKGSAIYRFVKQ